MLVKIAILTILFVPTINTFAQKDLAGISEFYLTNMDQGQIAFMWLGEGRGEWAGAASAGVLLRTSMHTIIIDSSNILQDDTVSALESLDLILITHEHSDHFDADSTLAIHQKTGSPVVVSPGVYSSLQDKIAEDSLIQMAPNEIKTVDGIRIEAIPSKHPSDRPVMYLINIDNIVVFHGSDSGFVDELNNIDSEVHLAFVPAGIPSPTASPDDAASMVRALKPYVTVPVHGMFEQMKALDDTIGNETVMIIPGAYVVKVPTQIVPEFGFAMSVLMAALGVSLVTMIGLNSRLIRKDN
ncbi:MAG: MBL fold metallo-hydrolase [Nitrososphaerales archaeon]